MDEQGYINVADLLNWHKMRKELNATFEEVMEEVRDNEKQRFALLYVPPTGITLAEKDEKKQDDGEAEMSESTDLEGATATKTTIPASSTPTTAATATATALSHALSSSSSISPSHFLIRATQGHSIKSLNTSTYLTPINVDSLPSTVVHGTFHAAWPAILKTGGLKPMSRVHVHFAQGPSLASVMERTGTTGETAAISGAAEEAKDARVFQNEGGQGQEEVISGMRSDAQILIYINIATALEMGIPFWLSENGVVLSEGVETDIESKNKKQGKVRLVPTDCWDVVVEVGEGLGVIWRSGIGAVKEVPARLLEGNTRKVNKSARGGNGNKNRSKADGGGKPRLRVARDDGEDLR